MRVRIMRKNDRMDGWMNLVRERKSTRDGVTPALKSPPSLLDNFRRVDVEGKRGGNYLARFTKQIN